MMHKLKKRIKLKFKKRKTSTILPKYITKKGIDPKSLSDEELKTQMIDIIQTSIKSKPWAEKLKEYFDQVEK